jgi:transcriptional regulator with XRE-family HTH domain
MRELRLAAGLGQDQVAQKLGRSASWVAKREQGAVLLSVPEAEAVAAALGVSPADLTGGMP